MISSVSSSPSPAASEALVATAAGAQSQAPARTTTARPSRASASLQAAAAALTPAKKKTTGKASKTSKSSTAKKTGYASTAAKTSKATGALAFLDDPRISTEEKLFRFMMYAIDRSDRALEEKMKAAGGKATGSTGSTTTTTTKKKSNPFSKLAGALKTVIPGAGMALSALNNKNLQSLLKTIAGPTLAAGATALGMPGLAPLLAKAGPQLAGVAFDLAKAFDETEASTSSSVKTTTSGGSGSTSGASGDPEIDRKAMLELQYAMDKQKEMFSLVSNMMRSMHDMKMVAANNIR